MLYGLRESQDDAMIQGKSFEQQKVKLAQFIDRNKDKFTVDGRHHDPRQDGELDSSAEEEQAAEQSKRMLEICRRFTATLADLRRNDFSTNKSRQRALKEFKALDAALSKFYLSNVATAVFCTNNSAYHDVLVDFYQPTHLFMDEAARSDPANTLTV